MSGDKLILTPISNGEYIVYADWNCIPAGFITDGASIPRFLWRVIGHPFESDYIEVYVMHDYDYATGRILRADADSKMRDGLAANGMGWLKRNLVYAGVRLFGRSHYNNAKKEVEDDVRL